MAKEDYELRGLARATLLNEVAEGDGGESAYCPMQGRVEMCREAFQEQWQLPAGRVRWLSPSVGRGEEEGGQSVLVEELIFPPLKSPYIPAGGWGRSWKDPGRCLGQTPERGI